MCFAGLPACYQNLEELVRKMHSKVGNVIDCTVKPAESGTTQSNAAASTRQEGTPDYSAADDEFPQGTTTASILCEQTLRDVQHMFARGSPVTVHMASSYTCHA